MLRLQFVEHSHSHYHNCFSKSHPYGHIYKLRKRRKNIYTQKERTSGRKKEIIWIVCIEIFFFLVAGYCCFCIRGWVFAVLNYATEQGFSLALQLKSLHLSLVFRTHFFKGKPRAVLLCSVLHTGAFSLNFVFFFFKYCLLGFLVCDALV